MKLFYLLLMLFIFAACSSRGVEYVMPTPHVAPIGHFNSMLGVAEVKVPPYLNSDKILVQKGSRLYKIDANFASTPSKMLTQNAIVALKRSLSTPNVFLYPWEFKTTKGLVVIINLDDFVYRDGYAVVAGSYYIKRAQGGIVAEQNFRYSQACNEKSEEIVETLSDLFNRVLKEVARKIARR